MSLNYVSFLQLLEKKLDCLSTSYTWSVSIYNMGTVKLIEMKGQTII